MQNYFTFEQKFTYINFHLVVCDRLQALNGKLLLRNFHGAVADGFVSLVADYAPVAQLSVDVLGVVPGHPNTSWCGIVYGNLCWLAGLCMQS